MTHKVYLTTERGTETILAADQTAAEAIARAFQCEHFADKNAQVGIWDGKRYTLSWVGGHGFGPFDTRHPLEVMSSCAIKAGHRVSIIDGDRGEMVQFNAVPAMQVAA